VDEGGLTRNLHCLGEGGGLEWRTHSDHGGMAEDDGIPRDMVLDGRIHGDRAPHGKAQDEEAQAEEAQDDEVQGDMFVVEA